MGKVDLSKTTERPLLERIDALTRRRRAVPSWTLLVAFVAGCVAGYAIHLLHLR
jgi:type VI protein secretion system component VasF